MPVTLCWNAIVKDESGRIERAMQSLVGVINGAVIADTGSTDDTKSRIQAFCALPLATIDKLGLQSRLKDIGTDKA